MAVADTDATQALLDEVAGRIIGECLGVQRGESFVLLTDDLVCEEVTYALLSQAVAHGADPTHVAIKARLTSGQEPPSAAVAAMMAADVCLCVAGRSVYHTQAKGAAQEAGTRGCFNAPTSLEAWTAGAMTVDFREIRKTAERLADRLRGAHLVRVTSPAGCDVTVSVRGREPQGWLTGIVREPGEATALPGGEVSFPPVEGTSDGVIVLEGVMTDVGLIDEPIVIDVEGGLATSVTGGFAAARLRELIKDVPGATNIGELGIGLNPLACITSDITESKKKLGTAHFALGDNGGGYGGIVDCDLHLDGMVFDPTITIDGEIVMRAGELVL